jgi:hypothetical protein
VPLLVSIFSKSAMVSFMFALLSPFYAIYLAVYSLCYEVFDMKIAEAILADWYIPELQYFNYLFLFIIQGSAYFILTLILDNHRFSLSDS